MGVGEELVSDSISCGLSGAHYQFHGSALALHLVSHITHLTPCPTNYGWGWIDQSDWSLQNTLSSSARNKLIDQSVVIHMVDAQTGESVHKDLSCFALVVTSHGGEGSIVGSDHRHIKITDMLELLSPKNFPEMKGKPKIVIIQACAGGELLWLQFRLDRETFKQILFSYNWEL